MKSGVRALGVAESFRTDVSVLAGVVVRASRVTDGFVFGSCSVGGTDATDAIADMVERLGRDDVQYLLVAGIAPAWFNLVDLHALAERCAIVVISVTFEESTGLESTIREEFTGEAREWRLDTYAAQPGRNRVRVNGETVFVRSVGCDPDEARAVVRAFTPEGGRPEPLRVARLAARAARAFALDDESSAGQR